MIYLIKICSFNLKLHFVFLIFLVCLYGHIVNAQDSTIEKSVRVDLQLLLAVDISQSIDIDEARLQRNGYIASILDPYVIRVITGGEFGRIALAYTEWAGPLNQTVVVDWSVIDGLEAAQRFARQLATVPIGTGQRTSISYAILHAISMFRRSNFTATRKAIDISGDGANNAGFYVHQTRYKAVDEGITINGLAIMNNRPSPLGIPATKDIDLYYEDCVIAGAGAFVVVAQSKKSFAAAVRRKIILEIAGLHPKNKNEWETISGNGSSPIQASFQPVDCTIGEKQLQHFRRDKKRLN